MWGTGQAGWVFVGLLTLGSTPWIAQSHAVSFGNGSFEEPEAFFAALSANPSDGEGGHAAPPEVLERLKQASAATVLIGGHASGVILSSDGLMITARHVIADDYAVGPTKHCQQIPLYLNHEVALDGSVDRALKRIECEEILVNDYPTDFVLLRLRSAPGQVWPVAEPELEPTQVTVTGEAYALGYPHASQFNLGVKKISKGPIVRVEPDSQELPHFLHRIDTEGGSSGGAILGPNGKLWGLHFRGVPDYSRGVEGELAGVRQKFTRFNVALLVPTLLKKFNVQTRR